MTDAFEAPWSEADSSGRISLSLANTLDWRGRETPTERLVSYEELLRWARSVGVLTGSEARALRVEAERHPRRAARVLRRAIELREALASLFFAATRGRRLPAVALRCLDRACCEARAAEALCPDDSAAAWRWRRSEPELERPMYAAALDAAELTTSDALERVRACADTDCAWLFLDTSRNRSRRWCSMESCGNRNKARTFYHRSVRRSRRDRCE